VTHIYFDILGVITILYTTSTAALLNAAALLCGTFYLYKQRMFTAQGMQHFTSFLLALLSGIAAPALIGAICVLVLRHPMVSFFTHSFLVLGLYAVPSAWAMISVIRWRWHTTSGGATSAAQRWAREGLLRCICVHIFA
jgi:hypothetical protein